MNVGAGSCRMGSTTENVIADAGQPLDGNATAVTYIKLPFSPERWAMLGENEAFNITTITNEVVGRVIVQAVAV